MPDVSGNPWVLTPLDEGWATSQQVFVHQIAYCNYTNWETRVLLRDGDGRVIFDQRGSTSMDPVIIDPGCLSCFGLKVESLPEGEIHLFIR
jgi:hypothetical protein